MCNTPPTTERASRSGMNRTLKDLSSRYTVGLPGLPFTDQICIDGKKIGPGANSGEPEIGTLPSKPISTAALVGLSQPFSPSFVKTITKGEGSALTHETPQGNQANYLEELCVKVPIQSYTVKVNGTVENVRTDNNQTDCIAVVLELPDPIKVATPKPLPK